MTTNSTPMVAAIGFDGVRLVVLGLGATVVDACRDSEGQGLAYVEISAALTERIKAGEVNCQALGITVDVMDR